MIDREALIAHVEAHHRRIPTHGRRPTATIARHHADEHYRYGGHDHYHAGLNLGPGQRPDGWETGADAVERKH